MRISTSTNIHQLWKSESVYSAADSIRLIKEAGFEAVDISMHTASIPGGPIASDTWQKWMEEVGEALGQTGLKATQSHAMFRSGLFTYNEGMDSHIIKMIKRNMYICGQLGIPETTIHPLHHQEVKGLNHDQIMKKNVEWYHLFEDEAAKYNVGIAIENMFPGPFATADELLELIDLLGATSGLYGICWDTGHANITGQNQYESIMKMGKQLKCTHIADNRGKTDDHVIPRLGNIDWEQVSAGLKTSGYCGDFTYEVQELTRYLPERFHLQIMKFAVDVAKEILIE